MNNLGTATIVALLMAGIAFVGIYSSGASMGWDEDLLSVCAPATALVAGVMGFAIGLGIKIPATATCPHCKETISADATVCKVCRRDIPPGDAGE